MHCPENALAFSSFCHPVTFSWVKGFRNGPINGCIDKTDINYSFDDAPNVVLFVFSFNMVHAVEDKDDLKTQLGAAGDKLVRDKIKWQLWKLSSDTFCKLKVKYELTKLGKTLIPVVQSIAEWGDFALTSQAK